MTITKTHIAETIANKIGVPKTTVYNIINMFLEEIKNHFFRGRKIELRGFGTFFPYFKRARTFRVPRSGEEREMPERTTLKFKTSKQLYIYKGRYRHAEPENKYGK